MWSLHVIPSGYFFRVYPAFAQYQQVRAVTLRRINWHKIDKNPFKM